MSKVLILGAGTWGIALARLLSNNGNNVTVWSAIPEEIDNLATTRIHPNLPGMDIPKEIIFSKDIVEVTKAVDFLFCAVPSIYLRNTISKVVSNLSEDVIIVDVAKGIEKDTLYTMSDIIKDEFERVNKYPQIVALSGPTHAEEVAKDMPTTIVSASSSEAAARKVQAIFIGSCIRAYTNQDIKGVEICGALKNVVALAAGISSGLGYGDNAKAALITRGMAEITRLGIAMGCNKDTFFGLAGIGDLVVTATSEHSRNNKAGKLIGQGRPLSQALSQVGMVVEGINTLPAALQLANKYNVNMPIVMGVDRIVNLHEAPETVVQDLMNRDAKEERPY